MMRAKWGRIRRIGSSGRLALGLMSTVVGCESTRMFMEMKPWQVHKCGMPRWHEAWTAKSGRRLPWKRL